MNQRFNRAAQTIVNRYTDLVHHRTSDGTQCIQDIVDALPELLHNCPNAVTQYIMQNCANHIIQDIKKNDMKNIGNSLYALMLVIEGVANAQKAGVLD